MKALVFEQWQGGHYFNYLACLVPRLAALCDEVVVAITESAHSAPLFDTQLGHLRTLGNVRFDLGVVLPRPGNPVATRLQIGRNLSRAIARAQPEFVFVPSADEHLLTLPLGALVGQVTTSKGATIEAVVHYKSYTSNTNSRERLTSLIQRRLLGVGAISRLNFVNFLQYEAAVERGLGLARIARVAGDPVPQPAPVGRGAARRSLGLPEDGRLIGMIGGLDERKAVLPTLAAFRAAKLARSDRLLLAGKLVPSYAEMIRSQYADMVRDGALIVLDRFLTDAELATCFAAVNLHCSVYNDFSGLSSLMLTSLAMGVPVLTSPKGCASAWTRARTIAAAQRSTGCCSSTPSTTSRWA